MENRILKKPRRHYRKVKSYEAYYEDRFGKMTKAMTFEAFDYEEATEKALRFANLIASKFSHLAER